MSASLENAVLEEFAKFEGFKELLEDDMEDPDPDCDVINSIKENQKELKKQYLSIKVAQTKYKAKLVPSAIQEAAFNEENSVYKYNDTWLIEVKKEYQKVHKAASAFLRNKQGTEVAEAE